MARRRTCYFEGRVQGVGFRFTASDIALRHNVTGFVRNLADGRVELVLEGEEPEMARVVDEIARQMNGYIARRTDQFSAATGEFDGFGVRY